MEKKTKEQRIEDMWIRYLHKKEILLKGLRNFEHNQEEIKEFKRLLWKISKLNLEKEGKKTCATKHVILPKSKDSGILPKLT